MDGGRVVAVLGGCGFIGSALVRRLLADGHARVVVVDLLAGSRPRYMLPEDPRIEVIEDDARRVRLTDIGAPATVYYLCAAPFVPDSHEDPDRTEDANVSVLGEFLENNSAERYSLVYASSGEVYGHVPDGCAAEDRPFADPDTLSAYGASRVMAENLLADLCQKFGTKAAAVRLFNVVGPRSTQPYFVPEMIRQAVNGDVTRHGDLTTIRDFVWIGDTIDALVAAAAVCQPEPVAVNAASGVGWRMADVLSLVLELAGKEGVRAETAADRIRPVELKRLVGCGARAEELLGWRPTVGLAAAVARTLAWYRRNGSWPYETGPRF